METLAGVEQEVQQRRRRADHKRRRRRHEYGAPAGRRVLVVVRVCAERPRGGADDQPGERGEQSPETDPVDELLQGAAPRQAVGVRVERERAGLAKAVEHGGQNRQHGAPPRDGDHRARPLDRAAGRSRRVATSALPRGRCDAAVTL